MNTKKVFIYVVYEVTVIHTKKILKKAETIVANTFKSCYIVNPL